MHESTCLLHEDMVCQAYLIAILPNLCAASHLLGFKAACDSQFESLAWNPLTTPLLFSNSGMSSWNMVAAGHQRGLHVQLD